MNAEEITPPTAITRVAEAARSANEDLDILRRAATMQGTGNRHTAATARIVLELVQVVVELAGRRVITMPPEIVERLERIEQALQAAELPDLATLEETISALTARVASLEAELGTVPAAGEEKKPAKKR